MTRYRRRGVVCVVALLMVLAGASVAVAQDGRGSSIYDNISPRTEVPSDADKYPLNAYGLDYHGEDLFQGGELNLSPKVLLPDGLGGEPIISSPSVHPETGVYLFLYIIASFLYWVHLLLSSFVLAMLQFSWSTSLVEAVLAPALTAMRSLYRLVGGDLFAAVVCGVGVWAMLRVATGKVGSTLGQLLVSLACILLALFVLTQSSWAIPGAARFVAQLSPALVGSLSGDDSRTAMQRALNTVHDVQVRKTFQVLQFGGTSRCVDRDNRSVHPFSPACHTKLPVDKYTDRYLRAGPPETKARDLEYKAIATGKIPSSSEIDDAGMKANAFDGYHLSTADRVAVDAQQQPAAVERLGIVALVLTAGVGVNFLVGGLAVMIPLALIGVAFRLIYTALVMLFGAVPGAGHQVFAEHMRDVAGGLMKPAIYSLLLAGAIAMIGALMANVAALNWLVAEALVAVFAWGVVFQRNELYENFMRVLGGGGQTERGRNRALMAFLGYRHGARPMMRALGGPAGGMTGRLASDGQVLAAGGRWGQKQVARGGAVVAQRANDYASAGHKEQIVTAGQQRAGAEQALQREHQQRVSRLRRETADRQRVRELQARESRGREIDPDTGKPWPGLGTTEQAELKRLQASRMSKEDYEGLRASVHDVTRRTQDGGLPFTDAELTKQAAKTQATKPASQATRTSERLAADARQWGADHDRIFGADDRAQDRKAQDARAASVRARDRARTIVNRRSTDDPPPTKPPKE